MTTLGAKILKNGASQMGAIKRQYNQFATTYSEEVGEQNAESKSCFYEHLDIPLEGKMLLDMGCGEGVDFDFYTRKGALIHGIDESEEMVKIAKSKYPEAQISLAEFAQTPHPDETFDVVTSKWAYQTAADIQGIYTEVNRILKPGGHFVYLATHPLRQFLEKKKKETNYFQQEMVESKFFDGKITAIEPSHTFNEYLSPYFFSHFDLLAYEEQIDSAAEVIDGHMYPSFFILKARKKGRKNNSFYEKLSL